MVRQGPGTTGLSPSPAPPSRGLGPGPPLRTLLQTTIRTTGPPDSKAGLFPRVVPPDLGSRSERLSAKGSWSPNARRAVAAATKRVELQPPLAATSVDVDSHLGQPRARGLREASIRPATTARPAVGAPNTTHAPPPLGGAEEMKACRGSCMGAAHTGRLRSPRIGLDRMRAAPEACPERSIQYSPLARSHRLVRSLAPAAPSWTTSPITDTSVQ
ncbi:hypothetical protein CQW23_35455 [Capsicum baccatum]|uniref:Protein TAR1 n=1 Tax=Capsicum baccatum TaxID=33114 RepID=A0A2G2UVZ0_CAPBA|nr:hypothetical protein CQW23_35455 [Capsicum baccatum]